MGGLLLCQPESVIPKKPQNPSRLVKVTQTTSHHIGKLEHELHFPICLERFQPLLSNARIQRNIAFPCSLPLDEMRLDPFLHKQMEPITSIWLLHCSSITWFSVMKRDSSKIYYVTSRVVYDTNIVFCTLHLQLNY